MTSAIPENREIASLITAECRRYYEIFCSFNQIAEFQFRHRLWHDQRKVNIRRLEVVREHQEFCRQRILETFENGMDESRWHDIRTTALAQINDLPEPIILSFLTGLERSLYPHLNLKEIKDYPLFNADWKSSECVTYHTDRIDKNLAAGILRLPRLSCAFQDFDRDAARLSEAINANVDARFRSIEIYPKLFYRNKHAYQIGLIETESSVIPMGIALVNEDGGVRTDAHFFTETEIIRIFEFTRSYIIVDSRDPMGLAAFLHRVMPNKSMEQLIVNLGYTEWGKSMIIRQFKEFLGKSQVRLDHAPGIRGMVMIVFTSGDYPLVFKLIKEEIAYPKETTPEKVLEKYKLVAQHDRVGRLADSQLFERLSLPKNVFNERLLNEIENKAPGSVEISEDEIIFRKIFTERKMVPLNIYLENASEEDAIQVIIDYGNAIKDLAMSNIFPGDLLTKNFGVTTDKSVVFYDYDEVLLLTECNFLKMPSPRNDDELWDHETWTVARDNDIFPEELEKFIIPPRFREIFRSHHVDLFSPDFWNHWKKFHQMEGFMDLQPY